MVIYRLYDGHREVDMQECRNWQTSKTKDLVINAIVWVQVPSPALLFQVTGVRSERMRLLKSEYICEMQECRNWQTSKTKDLVINAIVWVQVPSPALLFQVTGVRSERMRLLKSEYICEMQECRNWQTSKTKDLVINAIVWVQVPSSA